jgi:hypothetical protein
MCDLLDRRVLTQEETLAGRPGYGLTLGFGYGPGSVVFLRPSDGVGEVTGYGEHW